MRALRVRMDALEQTVADDIDPPVVAIREAQYLDPADQRVANDEMQLAADQLVGALRLEPRRKADFAALGRRRNPRGERRKIGTANGDAGDRKSVVSGKRGSVRVDLGGRRIINTKQTTTQR